VEFKVKKKAQGEGSKQDEERNKKERHRNSSSEKDGMGEEPEHDKKHGGERDAEQEAHRSAGQDMLDAIQSGDPIMVSKAHRHLMHAHETSDPEGGGDDKDGYSGEGKAGIVSALKSIPLKTGV
jgi:hypothetical protein